MCRSTRTYQISSEAAKLGKGGKAKPAKLCGDNAFLANQTQRDATATTPAPGRGWGWRAAGR